MMRKTTTAKAVRLTGMCFHNKKRYAKNRELSRAERLYGMGGSGTAGYYATPNVDGASVEPRDLVSQTTT
eukprot:scaffold401_cov152-Amphora_coffeaeformis.AAC.5